MKYIFRHLFFAFFLIVSAGHAQNYLPKSKDSRFKVSPSKGLKAEAFDLSQVKILNSTFHDAMEADENYLSTIDPDRLLSFFRKNAGLQPKASAYGGWEADGLAGHSLGHYLSAIAMDYASSKDRTLLVRSNYIIDELERCQIARKTGYIGAIPNEDRIWAEVAKGEIKSGGFDLNGGWAPWYTVHKIMAGLLDTYLYTGNKKALTVCKGLGDWTQQTISGLDHEKLQKMLFCEYGGMAETLVSLYAITGQKKYLELSYKFYDQRILDPLAKGENILPGKHSNTQIPKIIASARRYALNGDRKDKAIADFFWKTVVNHHSYVTGGNSNYEYLGEPDKLNNSLSENTTETCNTYNMLKLTGYLFSQDPKAYFFDYYERALYNHILASQNHQTGMTCYFVPLRMGGKKSYSDPFNTFTCCVGTGMENHVKYNECIYFKGTDGSLYVNLFIPSELNWQDKEVKILQHAALPLDGKTSLTMECPRPTDLTIRLRRPRWCSAPSVMVNGITQALSMDENGYYAIQRKWKNGDKLEYSIPEHVYAEPMPDNPNRSALFFGPVLLAGIFGETEPDPVNGVPVFVSPTNEPMQWINRVEEKELRFSTNNIGYPKEVNLVPFYATKNQYYSVYWDVFSPEQWAVQQQVYEERKNKLKEFEDKTTDIFRPGEMQPERDHNFTSEKSYMGQDHGDKWRAAAENGFMEFDMKIKENDQHIMIASYWGMDNRGRSFDILIDGVKIASEDLNKYKESRFYEVSYPLPLDLTKGKSKVRIKFLPKAKNTAGPIYFIRVIADKI